MVAIGGLRHRVHTATTTGRCMGYTVWTPPTLFTFSSFVAYARAGFRPAMSPKRTASGSASDALSQACS